jgi:hypothetical protein
VAIQIKDDASYRFNGCLIFLVLMLCAVVVGTVIPLWTILKQEEQRVAEEVARYARDSNQGTKPRNITRRVKTRESDDDCEWTLDAGRRGFDDVPTIEVPTLRTFDEVFDQPFFRGCPIQLPNEEPTFEHTETYNNGRGTLRIRIWQN